MRKIYLTGSQFNDLILEMTITDENVKYFNRMKKKIYALSKFVEDTVEYCGGDRGIFLDKSSTLLSCEEIGKLIVLVDNDNEFKAYFENIDDEKYPTFHFTLIEDDGDIVFHNNTFSNDPTEDIFYIKKCVNNGKKMFESENPDAFMEQEEDDEE